MPTTPKTARKARSDSDPLQREMVSSDGVVQFVLQRASTGVRVSRKERLADGSRVTYSTLFHDTQGFDRFCAEDRLRFSYPLIYEQARRAFDQLYPTIA
jgi:hypothetical protein